ncbi:alpha/beta hydrolase protein [Rhizophagus irregularis DAOM 181602=DAOM 197198]|nr:alpha/beta hydrolase protein [Rhizophagus irregularis DAOM 181602=DAOM 197198]
MYLKYLLLILVFAIVSSEALTIAREVKNKRQDYGFSYGIYSYEAQVHLEKILIHYEHVLDTEWKDLNDYGINAEWIQVPNDG